MGVLSPVSWSGEGGHLVGAGRVAASRVRRNFLPKLAPPPFFSSKKKKRKIVPRSQQQHTLPECKRSDTKQNRKKKYERTEKRSGALHYPDASTAALASAETCKTGRQQLRTPENKKRTKINIEKQTKREIQKRRTSTSSKFSKNRESGIEGKKKRVCLAAKKKTESTAAKRDKTPHIRHETR